MNKLFLLSLATIVAALSVSSVEAGHRGKHLRGKHAGCHAAPVCCEPVAEVCCEPAPEVCCEPAPVVCCEPAPVVCCEPVVDVCCEPAPCSGGKRVGFFAKHRQAKAAKRAARTSVACCDPCAAY